MKKPVLNTILVLASILFSGAYMAVALVHDNFSSQTVSTFATFLLVLVLLYGLMLYRKKRGTVTQDEFTLHQNLKSFRNSWLITLLAVITLSNLNHFGIYSFPLDQVLGLLLLVMVLSFWLWFYPSGYLTSFI